MTYSREQYNRIKLGIEPKTTGAKPKKAIPRQSKNKIAELKQHKEAGGDSEMDIFFTSLRPSMTGKCLFCNGRTEKNDDSMFHFCLAHLLPKALFKSVATHPDITIELCYYGESCHTNFDNGIITWEFIKDSAEWIIIREKLLRILPVVAMEERKIKLYGYLEKLVYTK